MENNLNKYIVYCTTCLENGKIYIGVHKTNNPDVFDGYLGCGIYNNQTLNHPKTVFQKAIKKYGFSKFKRVTLCIFDNEEEAYKLEKQIVTEEFIKNKLTYNTALGGKGGSNLSYPKQYDLEGNFIKQYISVNEICKELNLSKHSLNDAMSRKKPLKGYYFISNGDIHNIIKSNELYSTNKERCISCYDIETNKLVKTYINLTKASIELKCSRSVLKRHIKNGEVFEGYLWSYGYSDNYELQTEPKPRKVVQYDLEGNLVKVWNRVLDCAKEHPKVRDVLKGKRNKTHGFIFKYLE